MFVKCIMPNHKSMKPTQMAHSSSLGDSSWGGQLTSQQHHSGHISFWKIITPKCPITMTYPWLQNCSTIVRVFQGICCIWDYATTERPNNITALHTHTSRQLLFSLWADCKSFENKLPVNSSRDSFILFPEAKAINIGEDRQDSIAWGGSIAQQTQ